MPYIHYFPNGKAVKVKDEEEERFITILFLCGEDEAIKWVEKRR